MAYTECSYLVIQYVEKLTFVDIDFFPVLKIDVINSEKFHQFHVFLFNFAKLCAWNVFEGVCY